MEQLVLEPSSLNKEVVQVLKDADYALLDWVQTFASELCDKTEVELSWDRINRGGGTLAYIAKLRVRINQILEDHRIKEY